MAPEAVGDGPGRIFFALRFAAQAHEGQLRKGTRVPYLVHPLGVCKLLLDQGFPDHLAIAGLLHDTVEDTAVTLDEIREHFGEHVARLVDFATESSKHWSWEKRKEHTLVRLATGELEGLCLSVADKLDNIRSIREELERCGEEIWNRFRRPREKQRWYYESLRRIFDERLTEPPAADLAARFRAEVELVFGV
jgi:(p)ppGpp synthase/HD superfamily hydrolase